jgi:hypothetical protein
MSYCEIFYHPLEGSEAYPKVPDFSRMCQSLFYSENMSFFWGVPQWILQLSSPQRSAGQRPAACLTFIYYTLHCPPVK